MQPFYIAQVSSPTPIQSANQAKQTECLFGSFVMVLPVLLVIGFLAHRKHRSFKIQQQIEWLERIWQLDSSKRRF